MSDFCTKRQYKLLRGYQLWLSGRIWDLEELFLLIADSLEPNVAEIVRSKITQIHPTDEVESDQEFDDAFVNEEAET